jgi:CRISPR-associated endonuclease Csn1
MQPHFSTAEVEQAVAGIAVSFKGGKRAASTGKRYIRKNGKRICVQSGIIIPRGALSEESIYGRISDSATGKHEYVIKYKIGSIALKDVDSVSINAYAKFSANGCCNSVVNPKKPLRSPCSTIKVVKFAV